MYLATSVSITSDNYLRAEGKYSEQSGINFTILNLKARGKEAESVWEHGVEENIWTEEGRGNGGMEEIA